MEGETFAYDGISGQWLCSLSFSKGPEGTFCAVADIAFCGEPRCKLVLSAPHVDHGEGIEALKRKCIEWIDKAEDEAVREIPSKRKSPEAG
ncbi:hypothetical protein ABL849_33430 (plasmid) [Variovorax sp. 375MFSha3.1]|uniref:hypothetical protein n=1 Tax=unclassified Variovorax TaxID=663243 RepID=UPI003AAEE2CB